MNRRILFLPSAAMGVAMLFAACGGSPASVAPSGAASAPLAVASTAPAAATTAVANTAAAATDTPVAATETVAVTPPSAASESPQDTGALNTPEATVGTSFVIPSFSFVPDTGLAAKFPSTIDGQPVTNVQTALFADVMRQFGTSDADLQTMSAALSAVGLDFSKLSFGSADANVDGEDVQLQALRTADADANKIIQNYPVIAAAFGNSTTTLPSMTQANIGGKDVTVSVDANEKKTVLYVTGDTLFIIDGTTDSQTTKILQALP